MSRDNKTLGTFKLDGIPPAPRGVPQIEVTFDIDANGILHVSAKEKVSGKEQKISIQGSSGLSQDEIEKAKREAEEHAEEDRKRKEGVEIKNKADTLAYEVEKQIKEWEGKVPAEATAAITDKVASLRKAVEADDIDAMKSQTESLEKLFAEAYQAAAAAGATAGAPESGMPDMGGAAASAESGSSESKDKGKVVDADFEVVDKDK
jgi:molecular chaperone DnaK